MSDLRLLGRTADRVIVGFQAKILASLEFPGELGVAHPGRRQALGSRAARRQRGGRQDNTSQTPSHRKISTGWGW